MHAPDLTKPLGRLASGIVRPSHHDAFGTSGSPERCLVAEICVENHPSQTWPILPILVKQIAPACPSTFGRADGAWALVPHRWATDQAARWPPECTETTRIDGNVQKFGTQKSVIFRTFCFLLTTDLHLRPRMFDALEVLFTAHLSTCGARAESSWLSRNRHDKPRVRTPTYAHFDMDRHVPGHLDLLTRQEWMQRVRAHLMNSPPAKKSREKCPPEPENRRKRRHFHTPKIGDFSNLLTQAGYRFQSPPADD